LLLTSSSHLVCARNARHTRPREPHACGRLAMPAGAGRAPQCRRNEALQRSFHRSTRCHGLRGINNNYVSDGTGRDWLIFGDPGFDGGRLTPRGADTSLPPQGDREQIIVPFKFPVGDGRRPVPNVPRGKDGSSLKPLPSTIRRWERSYSAPTALEATSGFTEKPDNPRETVPLKRYLTLDEQAKLDTQFKPNLAAHPLVCPTFPVEKYRFYSDLAVYHAHLPVKENDLPKPGPDQSTYTRSVTQKLKNPIISKHHYFSQAFVRNSPHFQTTSPHDGLAKPRRAFSSMQGRMTASLAEVPSLSKT